MKIFSIIIGCFVGFFLLCYFAFGISSFFSPKYRQLDNKTFKESEQYNDGMIRDLENLKMEYEEGDNAKKYALRGVILHRFSVYPEEKMSFELRSFYQQLKRGN